MNEKLLKQKSVADINAALKTYLGDSYVEPLNNLVCFNAYTKLSRHHVDQGVIAFVHACNLSGGSVGNMDLYRLIRTYLWSEEVRREINAVLKRCETSGEHQAAIASGT